MLKIELAPGESVQIGAVATVTLEEKSGQRARLSFDADRTIPIKRVRSDSDVQMAARYGLTMAEQKDAPALDKPRRL